MTGQPADGGAAAEPVPVTIAAPDPVPVTIAAPDPVPVKIIGPPAPAAPVKHPDIRVQSQRRDPSKRARTTFQEDLTTAGQRHINLIWERTQAGIALMVAAATMLSGGYSMITDDKPIPTIISVAFGTVIGFYFSRTNHEKVGGVGDKPQTVYRGR